MKKNKFRFIPVFLSAVALIFITVFAVFPLPGEIPVLMYHFVGSREDAAREKNFVSREGLASQMAFLKFFKYHPISMEEYYEIKTGKRKPKGRELLITFDDGNYSFDKEAYSILKPYEFPVTLFVVSESVKLETQGSMSAETIKKLLENPWITIGSHSKTHPLLSQLRDDQIEEELLGSKQDLEEMFGAPVYYLAYPSGNFDPKVMNYAQRAGYRLAFTTRYKNLKTTGETLHSLPRVKISRTSDNLLLFWVKISGIYQMFKKNYYRIKYAKDWPNTASTLQPN